jgi:DDE family transposase
MEILLTDARTLQQLCGSDLDDLAASTGVIKRKRKFGAITLLRTLVFTALKHRVPKPADFKRTALQFGVDVSKAAIPARLTDELVAFLRAVLDRAIERLLTAKQATLASLQGFTGIYLGDGTTVALPDDYATQFPGCGGTAGSGRAALKIQLLREILSGAVRRLVIESGKSSDALSPIAQEQVPAGSLMVFDLGYFCLNRFRRLIDAGVSWVSRLQFGVTVYDSAGRELSLLDDLQRRYDAGQRLIDITIFLGVEHRLRCRLIAVRVPQETAARRRQAAHAKAAKHGRTASQEYLRWQDWTIFVTDCSAERLTWQAVIVLYRTRWQIELMFKIWKSHNGLVAHRPEASSQEQLAMVYAKLIGAIVQHWVLLTATGTQNDRSLMKAAATLREWINNLAEALDDLKKLADLLERLREILRGDRVERRHRKPSHFQLLENPELLEWQI